MMVLESYLAVVRDNILAENKPFIFKEVCRICLA
jgi:hypothetical protein